MEFFSSLIALFGALAAKEFRWRRILSRIAGSNRDSRSIAFAAAIAIQALLILFPPPIWNIQATRTVSAAPPTEITWYGPAKDFPAILPAMRAPKPAARKDAAKPLPRRGADAFHPRQTILSEPLHPTHPRQTLIQPRAPQEPPKILPALPNIVQLAGSQPERPKLQLTAEELRPAPEDSRVARGLECRRARSCDAGKTDGRD